MTKEIETVREAVDFAVQLHLDSKEEMRLRIAYLESMLVNADIEFKD